MSIRRQFFLEREFLYEEGVPIGKGDSIVRSSEKRFLCGETNSILKRALSVF